MERDSDGASVRPAGPPIVLTPVSRMADMELGWTAEERNVFVEATDMHGDDWEAVTTQVGTRSRLEVEIFNSELCRRMGRSLLEAFKLRCLQAQRALQLGALYRAEMEGRLSHELARILAQSEERMDDADPDATSSSHAVTTANLSFAAGQQPGLSPLAPEQRATTHTTTITTPRTATTTLSSAVVSGGSATTACTTTTTTTGAAHGSHARDGGDGGSGGGSAAATGRIASRATHGTTTTTRNSTTSTGMHSALTTLGMPSFATMAGMLKHTTATATTDDNETEPSTLTTTASISDCLSQQPRLSTDDDVVSELLARLQPILPSSPLPINVPRKVPKVVSRYRGVHFRNDKGRWVSRIKHRGKRLYLGVFDREGGSHGLRQSCTGAERRHGRVQLRPRHRTSDRCDQPGVPKARGPGRQ